VGWRGSDIALFGGVPAWSRSEHAVPFCPKWNYTQAAWMGWMRNAGVELYSPKVGGWVKGGPPAIVPCPEVVVS
jgi:hypothetical protein